VTRTIGLLARFGLAGLVNTAVGFGVIVLLDPVLGLPPALANAIGYAAGMATGFVLNRSFVFRSDGALPATGLRYAIAVAASFALNQAVLGAMGSLLGVGSFRHLAAQAAAMAVYSTALFVICRVWVFGRTTAS
jgi:putative flippase GtrA